MEISFQNKSVDTYREISFQTKKVQESVESVVPDTDEDICQIASVQSSVLLKSKDITSRGVLISGEARASLLYIAEGQNSVSFVRLSKAFSIEYDIPDVTPDALAQINLSVLSAEARIINPRKVSVSFEIAGEMSCYVREALDVESLLPSDACPGLHVKYENTELATVNAVCEKTFSVNEQFSFPGGKPKPTRIVSGIACFSVADTQLVAGRIIVKGTANLTVCYLSDEVNYPVKAEFSTPYSQIIDIGEENIAFCSAFVELTGAYFDIADGINGEKILNTELHAVMQLAGISRRTVSYAADSYCNLMPGKCSCQECCFSAVSDTVKVKLTADERVNIADECVDVLSVFTSPARVVNEQGRISASIGLDVVYRTADGRIEAAKRSVSMDGESLDENVRIYNAVVADAYLRPDGQYVDGHFVLEISGVSLKKIEFEKLICVELDEEQAYEFGKYPTVTLVRTDGESLWELAKQYHSSVEKIAAMNDGAEGDLSGKMLLIPKTI